MVSPFSKWLVISFFAAVVLGVGTLVFVGLRKEPPTQASVVIDSTHAVIGASVEGRPIEAYTFGSGATHLAFVGGIHGGYEWNSVLLAYQFLDYLTENVGVIPKGLTITVIPVANPDGLYKVIGKEGRFTSADVPQSQDLHIAGRFNAHGVDLNRNFDCNWKPESMWRGKQVSAGPSPFSEPEARALRDFVLKNHPSAVIYWHSQANAVYASACENGILPETLHIMNVYADAAGYPAVESFDAYEVTGDTEGWLASIGIPAITVELQTHETIEWEKNLAGIKALFEYYR